VGWDEALLSRPVPVLYDDHRRSYPRQILSKTGPVVSKLWRDRDRCLPVRNFHPLRHIEVSPLYGRPDLDALGERLDHASTVLDAEVVPLGPQVHRLSPCSQQRLVLARLSECSRRACIARSLVAFAARNSAKSSSPVPASAANWVLTPSKPGHLRHCLGRPVIGWLLAAELLAVGMVLPVGRALSHGAPQFTHTSSSCRIGGLHTYAFPNGAGVSTTWLAPPHLLSFAPRPSTVAFAA
jgi:hypothetical protein